MNKLLSQFSSYCPYLDTRHSIYIEYAEGPVVASFVLSYKKLGYFCEYLDECPYPSQDQHGRCPVYLDYPGEAHLY